jgi:periplasmic protein TonB
MSAKPSDSSSSAALTKFLPIGIIAVVILVVLYFFLSGGSKAPVPKTAAPGATAPAAAAPAEAAAAASDALPELTAQQLLKEAGTAMHENRLVAPAGNNAFEYYERLLEKEPGNQTAADALRETFPIVTGAVEQEINAGNVDEAARVINLLAKADPNNYTLTILRSKLDAKKKQVEREQAQQAAATAAAAARAQAQAAATAAQSQAANTPPATESPNATAATEPAAAPAGGNAPPARPAPKTVATATPPEPAPAGETHPAEIIKSAPPDYPPDAVRRRQEGWVEVEFTVKADGSVADPSVVNANPARVFNSAALSAVSRWTFKPRMENGKAVDEKVRRRIEFKF